MGRVWCKSDQCLSECPASSLSLSPQSRGMPALYRPDGREQHIMPHVVPCYSRAGALAPIIFLLPSREAAEDEASDKSPEGDAGRGAHAKIGCGKASYFVSLGESGQRTAAEPLVGLRSTCPGAGQPMATLPERGGALDRHLGAQGRDPPETHQGIHPASAISWLQFSARIGGVKSRVRVGFPKRQPHQRSAKDPPGPRQRSTRDGTATGIPTSSIWSRGTMAPSGEEGFCRAPNSAIERHRREPYGAQCRSPNGSLN